MFLLITWRNIYTQMSPKKDREFRRSVRLLAAEAGQLTQYAFLPFSRFCHFSNMPTAQQVSANLGLLRSFCPSDVCDAKQRMWYNKIDPPAWSLWNVVVDYYRTLPAPRPFCYNCFRHIWYLPLFVKIWQKDVKKWWFDLRGTIYTLWPQNVPKALSLIPIPIVSRVQLVRNSWGSNNVERHSLPPALFCPLNRLSAEECALHRLWRHETQSEFVQRRHRGSLRKPHHAHTEPRQGAKVEDCVKNVGIPRPIKDSISIQHSVWLVPLLIRGRLLSSNFWDTSK